MLFLLKKILNPLILPSISMVLMLAACAGTDEPYPSGKASTGSSPPENLLRVGVSANYPPIVFKEHGKFAGVEIEFAKLLAKELKRPVRAINIPWNMQIPSLLNGKTDIIMSGMSVTKDRAVRIAFTAPYLITGLVAATKNSDKKRFKDINDLLDSHISIGVIRGTVGEKHVRQNFIKASRIILFDSTEQAASALISNEISLFIHDAPAIMWTVSKHEADLCGIWIPIREERLAWGVRKEETKLREQLNKVIRKWHKNGTIDSIIDKWLPYRLQQ